LTLFSARHVHPSFVRNGNIEQREIQTGGQVKFSAWTKTLIKPYSFLCDIFVVCFLVYETDGI
jgi:hypothetical protein